MLTKMENRILYRFDNEQVMIEPWGLDALRVRATCAASFYRRRGSRPAACCVCARTDQH